LPDYKIGIECVKELLYTQGREAYDSQTLRDYYQMLYGLKNLDAYEVMEQVAALAFQTIREGENGFRLIKTAQEHLVVYYGTDEEQQQLH